MSQSKLSYFGSTITSLTQASSVVLVVAFILYQLYVNL